MMTWRAKGQFKLTQSAWKQLKMAYLVVVAGEDETFRQDYDSTIKDAFQGGIQKKHRINPKRTAIANGQR